jgi:acyl carrier protein
LLSAAGPAAATLLPREWLVVGGEACPWELVEEVRRIGECKVLNHYGPTETTVGASTFVAAQRDIEPLSATVPIGFPLANVQLHVLDAARQRTPIGIPGELWIGGAGVAAGYVNRPDLTAERFVEVEALGRLYRTGDRVRRLPDGAIEFLGRGDGQVKIRGFRVELGEIEQVIDQLPGVDRAVVSLGAPAGPTGEGAVDDALIAWVVPKKAGYSAAHAARPTEESVRAWVAGRLPDYMTPTAVVILDELPLNTNGKLDRRALPVPGVGAAGAREVVAPRTDTERALVAIWAEALKRDAVGIRDNFFELGGHSLIAIRVLGKVSRVLGVRMSLRSLFEAPTIEQLAERVDAEKSTGGTTPGAAPIKSIPRAAARGAEPPKDG